MVGLVHTGAPEGAKILVPAAVSPVEMGGLGMA